MNNKFTNQFEKSMNTMPYVHNQLIKSRSIIISGEINQQLAEKVMTQLLILQEISHEPIKIFINSQGGHVEAGDTLHDMIKFIRPEVMMIGTGWVASAGITIFLAANKENRYSLPNTRFMIHQPLITVSSDKLFVIGMSCNHSNESCFFAGLQYFLILSHY